MILGRGWERSGLAKTITLKDLFINKLKTGGVVFGTQDEPNIREEKRRRSVGIIGWWVLLLGPHSSSKPKCVCVCVFARARPRPRSSVDPI